MESMDEYIISRYMMIDKRIEQLKQKKVYKQWAFYQQSFCTTIAYTGYEIVAQAIRADKAIETLDETLRVIDHQIEILEMKQGFWRKFLQSLTTEEQLFFHKKYIKGYVCLNERLDNLAIEEIGQINEAIAIRYATKREYAKPIQLIQNDFMGNIDRMLDVVEV